jgi:hypothetical protein
VDITGSTYWGSLGCIVEVKQLTPLKQVTNEDPSLIRLRRVLWTHALWESSSKTEGSMLSKSGGIGLRILKILLFDEKTLLSIRA